MFRIYLEDQLESYSDQQINDLIATFPAQRQKVALNYKQAASKRESALVYYLLCHGLSDCFGMTLMPEFSFNEHGKPYLSTHPHIHFNLSHCKAAVLCGVSDHPIGVDIEQLGRYKESVARYTMNEEEMQRIASSENPQLVFTRLWTQKEAVVKLKGCGINSNMKDLLLPEKMEGIIVETVEEPQKGYVYSIAFFTDPA